MQALTWDQIRHRRLMRSSLLDAAPRERLVDVVAGVCGIQAQVMGAAELAIALRVNGVTQRDVAEELWERRTLVKTYGPRGTLHLLPARDLTVWMAAMRAVPDHARVMWHELADVSAELIAELICATREALDGRMLTREELSQALSPLVGPSARERLARTWGDLLAPAALSGALCFGPNRGSRVTLVRTDQWIGGWRDEDPDLALLTVLRWYLSAYGPATPADFARWFAVKPGLARELFERLGEEIVSVEVEGAQAWLLEGDAADLDVGAPARGIVRLLPRYDCFVLGSGPREQVVPTNVQERVRSIVRGRWEGVGGVATLLVDGRVAGMWTHLKRGDGLEIAVEVVAELTAQQRQQVEDEVGRIGRFLGASPTLSIGTLR